MKLGVRLGLFAVLAFSAAAAHAQLAPGYSGSSTTSYMINPVEYWQTLRSFGACYARQSEANAWALIATEPNSKAEAAVYKQMRRGQSQGCLTDTSLQAAVPLIRGAIAEALYKNGAALPADLRQEPPPAGQPIRTLGEAARCYASAHRAEAEKLLADTAPGSKKELEALNAMSNDFFACLPGKAQKRAFNPTQIRYRLAEVLLRMPAAAAVVAEEAAK